MDPISGRLFRGAGAIPLEMGRGPLVLVYHSLSPKASSAGWSYAVSPRRFKAQMELLSTHGWTTVTAGELGRRRRFPPKTVAVTFDDGYLDNYEYGFQCLQQLGLRATWFVVSGDVGGKSTWPDNDHGAQWMLDAERLRTMADAGMEIGCHTRSHARLPTLDSQQLINEVAGPRQELEHLLGQAVTSFAYPYGKMDERSEASVRAAGYEVACTTEPGWLGTDCDPLRIRRVTVFGEDSLATFARKLAFADNAVGWGRMARYILARCRARLVGA